MKKIGKITLFVGFLLMFGCTTENGADEDFLSPDGQFDSTGLEINYFDDVAVRELLNQGTTDAELTTLQELLTKKKENGGVGLSEGNLSKAVSNIITHRKGDDMTIGTDDDNEFDNIQELDDIPFVGQEAWALLQEYVKANGWVQYDVIPPNKIGQEQLLEGSCIRYFCNDKNVDLENAGYIKVPVTIKGGNHGLFAECEPISYQEPNPIKTVGPASYDYKGSPEIANYFGPPNIDINHNTNGTGAYSNSYPYQSLTISTSSEISISQEGIKLTTNVSRNWACPETVECVIENRWTVDESSFITDNGQTDSEGTPVGIFDSTGVREFLNQGTTNEELDELFKILTASTANDGVGLVDGNNKLTAENIIAYRTGDDGIVDSTDQLFDTLAELDNVPYVDINIWKMLKQYALTHGYMQYDFMSPEKFINEYEITGSCVDASNKTVTVTAYTSITEGNHGLKLNIIGTLHNNKEWGYAISGYASNYSMYIIFPETSSVDIPHEATEVSNEFNYIVKLDNKDNEFLINLDATIERGSKIDVTIKRTSIDADDYGNTTCTFPITQFWQ